MSTYKDKLTITIPLNDYLKKNTQNYKYSPKKHLSISSSNSDQWADETLSDIERRSSIERYSINTSPLFKMPQTPLEKTTDYDENDPQYYNLPIDFPMNSINEFLYNEINMKTCRKCNKSISIIKCFYEKRNNTFICPLCAATEYNNYEQLKECDWECQEKHEKEGYIRCTRLAHYKPLSSFINRDKHKSDRIELLKSNNLKIEKQCSFCRNLKKFNHILKLIETQNSIYN